MAWIVVSVTLVFVDFIVINPELCPDISAVVAEIAVFVDLEGMFSRRSAMVHMRQTSQIIEDVDVGAPEPRLAHVHSTGNAAAVRPRRHSLHVTYSINVRNVHTCSTRIGVSTVHIFVRAAVRRRTHLDVDVHISVIPSMYFHSITRVVNLKIHSSSSAYLEKVYFSCRASSHGCRDCSGCSCHEGHKYDESLHSVYQRYIFPQ